jgi:uncharacterized membrane protein
MDVVAAPRTDRIAAFDVVRGSAMLLVFLSHFSLEHVLAVAGPRLHTKLAWLTLLSTPAFVLVSGMMLGLLRSSRGDFTRMRDKLIDRGLFLLIVARPLIALAHVARSPDWRLPFIDEVFITDTVGVCLVMGAMLAEFVSDWGRVRLGIAVLVSSWALDVWWAPGSWATRLLKELLFGRLLGESLLYNFPILPWFGWYLVGSGLGAFVARAHVQGGASAAARIALRVSAIGASVAILARLVAFLLRLAHTSGISTVAGRGASMLALGQKLPPGVTFLAFYGAVAAMGVAGALLWGERIDVSARWSQPVWDWLAMLGRNSLLAFVLQFYVYYTAVHLLPKPPLWTAPFYFALTVVLLMGAIAACDRLRLNRFFSVGFAWFARGRRERRHPQPSMPAPASAAAVGAPSRDTAGRSAVVGPGQ